MTSNENNEPRDIVWEAGYRGKEAMAIRFCAAELSRNGLSYSECLHGLLTVLITYGTPPNQVITEL